ncbi:unnamed protein product [Eruca vesicaria subsp. sativa]|uniref:RNA helicase n=1 Tax=Eruca vesicaria subsp. sativa TaxID=29727 RepID=A0ABC8JKI2_ERUVS|nr:unnamed protein product [Eruca vesicaria subsp. sativa]
MKGEDTNLDLMPSRKKNKGPGKMCDKLNLNKTTLRKSQKRNLKKLEEEIKEKELLSAKTSEFKYKLSADVSSLLQSSKAIGRSDTKLEKRRRTIQLSKIGVVSEHSDEPVMDNDSCMDEPTTPEPAENVDIPSLQTDSEQFVNANELDSKVMIPAEEACEEDEPVVDMNLLTTGRDDDVDEEGLRRMFLYETGFGSKKLSSRSGVIGITQPCRVAVLATAKRVVHELSVGLGQDVGFKVRCDKNIGENAAIKSMTDGILLHEIQNDFLLRRYSVIILVETHERSFNTDILIWMLTGVIKIWRHNKRNISPPKSMSETLRVEGFVSERKVVP